MQVWIGRVWVYLSVIGMMGFGSFGTLEGQTYEWNETQEMQVPRFHHSSTLLQNGLVLVAGGENNDALRSAELYDPETGTWSLTGSMEFKRAQHTATLLSSGKVLVVGGRLGDTPVGDAEIYDPETKTWSRVDANMGQPRYLHTATLLPTGEVLVVGGKGEDGADLSSCEIYEGGAWSRTDPLVHARSEFTATLLENGDVLVIGGGQGGTRLTSIERYVRTREEWVSGGDLPAPRSWHSATTLPSGKVLIAGGNPNVVGFTSVKIYDPDNPSFETAASLAETRGRHTAVLLPSSKVLLIGGGTTSRPLTTASIYDPEANLWAEIAMLQPRQHHSTTLLPSGEILVAGGQDDNNTDISKAEIFSEISGTWTPTKNRLHEGRSLHTATLLPNGNVMVAGGCPGAGFTVGCREQPLTSIEIYDPGSQTWHLRQNRFPIGRYSHTATRLQTGEVLIAGGRETPSGLAEAPPIEAFLFAVDESGVDGNFIPAGSTEERRDATATLLPDGRVLLAGGYRGGALNTSEIYNPETGSWHSVDDLMAQARGAHTATLLPTGEVLVVGGHDNGEGSFQSAELFDPITETWRAARGTFVQIFRHTATLLPSGKVLVAGGGGLGDQLRAEVYDPYNDKWERTNIDPNLRFGDHAAALLPSGQVMLAGGIGGDTTALYFPTTDTWSSTGLLTDRRANHTLTVLASGNVLAVGGSLTLPLDSSEEYASQSLDTTRRPMAEISSEDIGFGNAFQIQSLLRNELEASDGTTASSNVNYPIFQLRSADGLDIHTLAPASVELDKQGPSLSDATATYTFNHLPTELNPGRHYLTATVAGIPSEPQSVEVSCSDQLIESVQMDPGEPVAIGGTVNFEAVTQGVRRFQWYRDDLDSPIQGATEAEYDTPPLSAADDGAEYFLQVWSGCASATFGPLVIIIEDLEDPSVDVLPPLGGNIWPLKTSETNPSVDISWTMSDNVRICRVDVELLYSNDNGESYTLAPPSAGTAPSQDLPRTLGTTTPDEPYCNPDVPIEDTNIQYFLPTTFPSGDPDSDYKIRVRVTDQQGNSHSDLSTETFSIVDPVLDYKTLILTNRARMETRMGLQSMEDADLLNFLEAQLKELARHDRVDGLVVDLGSTDSIGKLYERWDQVEDGDVSPSDPYLESVARANQVLFGCRALDQDCLDASGHSGGIHERILEIVRIFPNIEYLVLVGDDRIFPMARLQDLASLWPESEYVSPSNGAPGDLSTTTAVGKALASNFYLSDDPLANLDPTEPDDLSIKVFIPDLAVGRLVEEPEDILKTIDTFQGRNGFLDLTELDPSDGHKVQTTGYDFLQDSEKAIRLLWIDNLNAAGGVNATHTVDYLVGNQWNEEQLGAHLCGDGQPYGVINLNGHATHYQEGVPSGNPYIIQGLSTGQIGPSEESMSPPTLCGEDELDLSGSVIYAVGCHGGLPVAGSSTEDVDHSLDLPQTFLNRGAVAYIANSGFGWGLEHGIGYSERLVQIFSEELSDIGMPKTIGRAVVESKIRYSEEGHLDAYDEKTLMQWTVFGLPMYFVRLEENGEPTTSVRPTPPKPEDLPREEVLSSGIRITREISSTKSSSEDPPPPSPFITRIGLEIEPADEGTYQKFDAERNRLAFEDLCPTPAGCYYTLNNLSTTGKVDLPLEPIFVHDSSTAGTSLHGSLWLGGDYEQEEDWLPLHGTLISNGAASTGLEDSPQKIRILPTTTSHIPGQDPEGCIYSEDEQNSLVVPMGEVVCNAPGCDDEIFHRRYTIMFMDTFYYNNTEDPSQNCDRTGPTIEPGFEDGEFHSINGTTVSWKVLATDSEAEVWRVVVVYDRNRGSWKHLELAYTEDGEGQGAWEGHISQLRDESITYVLQAVDTRGNVTWKQWGVSQAPLKNSGVEPRLADTIEVEIELQDADISLDADVPTNVLIGTSPTLSFTAENLSLDEPANDLQLDICLSNALSLGPVEGTDWACNEIDSEPPCGETETQVQCTYLLLPPQRITPPVELTVTAPLIPLEDLSVTAEISAAQGDDMPANNTVSSAMTVNAESNVEVTVIASSPLVRPTETIEYILTLRNYGPHPVLGLDIDLTTAPGFTIEHLDSGPWDLDLNQPHDVMLRGHFEEGTLAGSYFQTVEAAMPPLSIDLDLSNNTVTTEVTVKPVGDLQIAYVETPATVTPEETVSFTVQLTNEGLDAIHGVDINVPSPFPGVPVVLGAGPWTQLSVVPGEPPITRMFEVTVPVDTASGPVEVNAQVVVPPDHSDSDLSNNTAIAAVDVVPSVDLGIVFVAPPSPVYPGQEVAFTVEIENPSIYTVHGVNVMRTAGPWFVVDEDQAPWSNITLIPEESRDLTLRGTIQAEIPEDVQLIVEIEDLVGYRDDNSDNDHATHDLAIEPRVDLELVWEHPPGTLHPGVEVDYTLRLINNGPDPVHGAHIERPAPPWMNVADPEETEDPWHNISLAPEADLELTLRGEIASGTPAGNVDLSIVAHVPNGYRDTDPDNNAVATVATVRPVGDLAVTFVSPPPTLTPMQGPEDAPVTFSLEVVNTGPDAIHGVAVTIETPFPGENVVLQGGPWTDLVVQPNASPIQLDFDLTVPTLFPYGAVQLRANVNVPADHQDSNPINNLATTTPTVVPQADLAIAFVNTPEEVHPGQEDVTFTVELTNLGPHPASQVDLSHSVPEWLEDIQLEGGDWSGLTLEVDVPLTRTLTGDVKADHPADDNATLSINVPQMGGYFDPIEDNNTKTATVNVVPVADLAITISNGDDVFDAGTGLEYVITVTSEGPDPMEGVEVRLATLPFEFENPMPEDATWRNLTVMPNDPVILEFTGTIPSDAQGDLSATATVEIPGGYEDPDLDNNSDTDTDLVEAGPPSLLVTKSADRSNVPWPGEDVTFTVTVENTSHDTDPVEITSLEDDIHGNLDLEGTCSVPFQLDPGDLESCSYTMFVGGDAETSETSTVTAAGVDDEGTPVEAGGEVTVNIVDAVADLEITVSYSNPTANPGDTLDYLVKVVNHGPDPAYGIEVRAMPSEILEDIVLGLSWPDELNLGVGDDEVLVLTGTVPNDANGKVITSAKLILPPTGITDPQSHNNEDSETTLLVDGSPSIAVTLEANPNEPQWPEDEVTFTVTVENTSELSDVFTLQFLDGGEEHGDLNGQGDCTLPQTIEPYEDSEPYTCQYTATVSGDVETMPTFTVFARGVDDEGEEAEAEGSKTLTIIDTLGPEVALVSTVSDTGDGQLTANEAVSATVTQLHVHFNETVEEESATHVEAYRLVGAGVDGVLQTETCGAPQGDDASFSIDQAMVVSDQQVAVWVHDGVTLPKGHYRLWVCDSITDSRGNTMLETSLDFQVVAQHQLQSSNFDGEAGLEDWISIPEALFREEDVGLAETSGSVELSTQGGLSNGVLISQCLNVGWPQVVELGGWAQVASESSEQPEINAVLGLYSSPGCEDDHFRENVVLPLHVGSSDLQWIDLGTHKLVLPAEIRSVDVGFWGWDSSQGPSIPFELLLDDLYLKLAPLHGDGFESGDTAMWSNTVP